MKTYFGFVILNQYPDVNFDVIVVIVSGCVCGLLIRLLWLLSALAEDKPQPPAQNNLPPITSVSRTCIGKCWIVLARIENNEFSYADIWWRCRPPPWYLLLSSFYQFRSRCVPQGRDSCPCFLSKKTPVSTFDTIVNHVLVLYGHCPNSFRLPPCSVKQTNVEKSAPNHPGKPLHPLATWEKVPQTILASLYTLPLQGNTGNAHVETTHFNKGLL